MGYWDNLPDDVSVGDPRAPWNEPDWDEWIADLEDRAALTEEREWYSDFLRRVAGEE